MNIITILLTISGFIGGIVSLKFLIINHYRINRSIGVLLYKQIKSDFVFKFIMEEELVFDKKDPSIFKALIKLNDAFLLFNKSERLLTAGWQSKEVIIDIYFFRWNTNKIKSMLLFDKEEKRTNIYAMAPYGSINIGSMDCNNYSLVADELVYKDIENDILRVLDGKLTKTSALLYGNPGNGKTRFVKYIAQKYELPIYTFYFNPDYTNLDILESFSQIPKKCIILLEDFDSYFEDRKCIIPSENIKFTFDVLLNCIDGVYNDYKEVIFFMTVNDINKVSDALKKRPSRFKFVREFTNPSIQLKTELLNDKNLALEIGDISLDQVFKIKDIKELRGDITIEEVKKII